MPTVLDVRVCPDMTRWEASDNGEPGFAQGEVRALFISSESRVADSGEGTEDDCSLGTMLSRGGAGKSTSIRPDNGSLDEVSGNTAGTRVGVARGLNGDRRGGDE